MRQLRATVLATAALLLISPSACGGGSSSGTPPSGESSPDAVVLDTPTGAPSGDANPGPIAARHFDPNDFDRSTTVDNQWFPLVPGTQFVYRGSTLEDEARIPHRVVFIVTDLTKVIGGVRNVVIWDRDYTGGQLVEAELAFFAQDNHGNVWRMGEHPEEYEEGKFVKAPTWISGLAGAKAGIAMRAEAQPAESSYSAGYAPAPINFVDRTRVYRLGQQTCVPADCYDDVLVTEEFERGKPGAFQLKFYAPAVGNVRVGWRGRNDPDHEVLKLVDLVSLDPEALAKAREAALQLEEHAYEVSDVYAQTLPLE